MKAIIAVLFLLFVGVVSEAQETYSVIVPAGDVPTVERERVKHNTNVCARGALSASCTQAQICGSAPFVNIVGGGSSCSAAQARVLDIEIYANSVAGREGFFIRKLLTRLRRILTSENKLADSDAKCVNWKAGNDTVKNAMCAAAGSPVPATVALGCQLCED
jgi:hypothetical protein